jgi:chromosome segregation ATPase
MSDDSLTTRVLIEIRDEIRELRKDANARIDQTNIRLDQLSERVDQTNDRIDHLRTELKSEIREVDLRTQTRLVELNATAVKTNEMLSDRFDLRDRVENCERQIEELKKKVG